MRDNFITISSGITGYVVSQSWWEVATDTFGSMFMAFLCGASAYLAKLGIDYIRKKCKSKKNGIEKTNNLHK